MPMPTASTGMAQGERKGCLIRNHLVNFLGSFIKGNLYLPNDFFIVDIMMSERNLSAFTFSSFINFPFSTHFILFANPTFNRFLLV
jgi:hypothetical protein